MLGNIWSFIKRHRRKFLFVGVLFGGAILVGKYAKKKMLEYQEKEAVECLAQIRKQHHFDGNQRNCNTTVLSLIPRLRETLCQHLNSEILTSKLKTRPMNKMEIWEELKILSFTRTIVSVYSIALLSLFLRVQLNVLGGYMYQDTLRGQNGKIDVLTTSDIQKQYLAIVHYLFEQGLNELIIVVQSAVENVLAATSLKDCVSSASVRVIVDQVREQVEEPKQDGGTSRLSRFVMNSGDDEASQACQLMFQEIHARKLHNETRDIVEGSDFNSVLTLCLDSSFHWLAHRTSECFNPTSTTNGIISMADVSMPFAKVIPVVNGLVHIVLGDNPNPLVQELLLKEQVKDFATNIYDAFCQPSTNGLVLGAQ